MKTLLISVCLSTQPDSEDPGSVEEINMQRRRIQTDMVGLNCQALTRMTLLCLPYMHPGSRIVNLASAAAFCPQPYFAVYAATKSYVLSFSRSLREELKTRGIIVTAVCPGPVDTPFFEVSGKPQNFLKELTMAQPGPVVHQALKDSRKRKEPVYLRTSDETDLCRHEAAAT